MNAMPAPVVVVTFYSRSGETERLATAAAVGAVQARAGIRMRRLMEPDGDAAIAQHPDSAAEIRRMRTEYVPPREADLLAADAIVLALPDDVESSSPVCAGFLELLRAAAADGRLAGRAAAVIGARRASGAIRDTLAHCGYMVLPVAREGGALDVDRAVALGRQLVAGVT
jgi:multimeric flavodoxin WrbA